MNKYPRSRLLLYVYILSTKLPGLIGEVEIREPLFQRFILNGSVDELIENLSLCMFVTTVQFLFYD